MVFAAIVAGGLGTRMGLDIPKQFMLLGSKPILIHTIEKFLICSIFDYICIGVHKDWKLYAQDMLKKFGITSKKIIITTGGANRNLTIMNIISKIEKKIGDIAQKENNIIVTHDAVRPFVTLRIIEENILLAKKYGACDTVVNSHDTIIKSDMQRDSIVEIPDRNIMFLGQTPQSFNMSKLKKFYLNISKEQENLLTDACKIFILNNHPIKLVFGEFFNIKITTTTDYKIAQSFIKSKIILN
ncbi:MAG: D-ribitol-5-phosphate cytidylyltransferase [Candidatus Improbicoccus devescovinae]|nr:MAG: D-ribitol-5-phosphate cytidylyltransferase [Candidatus Improbicoccus devescovinae]